MMTEETALFANEAFYAAFREGDFPAMSDLWARDAKQCCIHPMWPPLFGREAVLTAWKELLQRPPPVECQAPYVVSTQSMATVFCFERIDKAYLAATNVFILEGKRARMVLHQASTTRGKPKPESTSGRTIN